MNLSEDYTHQKLGLDSQTVKADGLSCPRTIAVQAAPTMEQTSQFMIPLDTLATRGDPHQDIVTLHRLINEFSDAFPAFHAFIFCTTAVRLHNSEESIVRLNSHLGGKAFQSRVMFLITNAPSRLVVDNNFLPSTKVSWRESQASRSLKRASSPPTLTSSPTNLSRRPTYSSGSTTRRSSTHG